VDFDTKPDDENSRSRLKKSSREAVNAGIIAEGMAIAICFIIY
jgi:hypothetical protein